MFSKCLKELFQCDSALDHSNDLRYLLFGALVIEAESVNRNPKRKDWLATRAKVSRHLNIRLSRPKGGNPPAP